MSWALESCWASLTRQIRRSWPRRCESQARQSLPKLLRSTGQTVICRRHCKPLMPPPIYNRVARAVRPCCQAWPMLFQQAPNKPIRHGNQVGQPNQSSSTASWLSHPPAHSSLSCQHESDPSHWDPRPSRPRPCLWYKWYWLSPPTYIFMASQLESIVLNLLLYTQLSSLQPSFLDTLVESDTWYF